MAVKYACRFYVRMWRSWLHRDIHIILLLTILCFWNSAAALDIRHAHPDVQRSSMPRRPGLRVTTQDVLKKTSQRIQRKIDLVDAALMAIRGQRAPQAAQHSPAKRVRHKDPHASNRREGHRRLAKTAAMLEDNANATGYAHVHHTWDGADDIWYTGPRAVPHRNKLVLAALELLPPLGMFGMDRLYLGQPLIAVCKMLSFAFTFGLLGTAWSMFDAFIVAQNCILQSPELEQFGMAALFGTEGLGTAAVMGVLIYLSWFFHIVYISRLIYRSTRPGGRFHHWYEHFCGKDSRSPDNPQDLFLDPFMAKPLTRADGPLPSISASKGSALADSRLYPPPPGFPRSSFVETDMDAQKKSLTRDERDRQARKHLYTKRGSSLRKWYRQDEAADFYSDDELC